MKKKPHQPQPLPRQREQARLLPSTPRYLFQPSVFDVELLGVDEVEQLAVLLPERKGARYPMGRSNTGWAAGCPDTPQGPHDSSITPRISRDPWRTTGREESGAGLEENLKDLQISEE